MKKYILQASGIAMALLLSTSLFSQDERDRNKTKLGEGDEIMIIKKGNKDGRLTVEVRDGEVTVNGKPLDEYKDGDVIVRRNRSLSSSGNARVYTPSSPFRGQGYSYGDVVDPKDRAYLGVTTEKTTEGARITEVNSNTAASKAGLREGDIITHIEETRIKDHDGLSAAIRKHKPDQKVNVTYLRDGRERQVVATLGKYPGGAAMVAPKFDLAEPRLLDRFNNENFNGTFSYSGRARLGIRAQDTEDGRGVKVLSVDEGSAADKAGIREGDVITEFEGKEVRNADELASAARSAKDLSSMRVRLQRDGRSQTVEIKIPRKLKTANL